MKEEEIVALIKDCLLDLYRQYTKTKSGDRYELSAKIEAYEDLLSRITEEDA